MSGASVLSNESRPYRGTERREGSKWPKNPGFLTSANGTSMATSLKNDHYDTLAGRRTINVFVLVIFLYPTAFPERIDN
jgi:hypothetical protein